MAWELLRITHEVKNEVKIGGTLHWLLAALFSFQMGEGLWAARTNDRQLTAVQEQEPKVTLPKNSEDRSAVKIFVQALLNVAPNGESTSTETTGEK